MLINWLSLTLPIIVANKPHSAYTFITNLVNNNIGFSTKNNILMFLLTYTDNYLLILDGSVLRELVVISYLSSDTINIINQSINQMWRWVNQYGFLCSLHFLKERGTWTTCILNPVVNNYDFTITRSNLDSLFMFNLEFDTFVHWAKIFQN